MGHGVQHGSPWRWLRAVGGSTRQAGDLWRALEAESGRRILTPTPHITFGAGLDAVHEAMRTAGAPCQLLTAGVVAERFPALRVGGPALFEPESSVLAADAALQVLASGVPEIRTGVRVLRLLTAAVTARPPSPFPVHEQLAAAWRVSPERAPLLRAALVLSADHEFNASAFAARVVASTGANLYGATMAGLAALNGPRHGGLTRRVAARSPSTSRARMISPAGGGSGGACGDQGRWGTSAA